MHKETVLLGIDKASGKGEWGCRRWPHSSSQGSPYCSSSGYVQPTHVHVSAKVPSRLVSGLSPSSETRETHTIGSQPLDSYPSSVQPSPPVVRTHPLPWAPSGLPCR